MFLRAILMGLVVFPTLLSSLPVQAAVEFNAETTQKLDALIGEKISWTGDTPAYSILIDQGGTVVYEKNIGFADIGNQVAATRDTVYKIGSISKSYTALAILQLLEQGKVDLDAPVSQYLADYEGPGAVATVRQLLTHTSGIPNYTALPEAAPIMSWVVNSREDIVALFRDKPLEFEPGSNYSYSNSGYYLLGLIIEAVSGQDYFEYLKANVFQPLDLNATYPGAYEQIVPLQARGYLVTQEGFANAAPTPQLTPFSAGTLEASAVDLVKYRRAVFHSAAVSDKLRGWLTETTTFPDGTPQSYALGALSVTHFYGHSRWGHAGGISGFNSMHDYYPDEDLTIVVLVNANGAPLSASDLAGRLAREIFSIPQLNDETVDVAEEILNSYVGTYRMSPFRIMGEFMRVVLKDGSLQLQMNDDDENPMLMPLLARSNSEFALAISEDFRISFVSEAGEVTGIKVLMSGEVSPGTRVRDSSP